MSVDQFNLHIIHVWHTKLREYLECMKDVNDTFSYLYKVVRDCKLDPDEYYHYIECNIDAIKYLRNTQCTPYTPYKYMCAMHIAHVQVLLNTDHTKYKDLKDKFVSI